MYYLVMPFFPDLNVLFIHIPKTGGTSIEKMLNKRSRMEMWNPKRNRKLLYPLNQSSPQHFTLKSIYDNQKVLNLNLDNFTYFFTIVRNPYDRVISDLFFYKLIRKDDNDEIVNNVLKQYLSETHSKYDNHSKPQYQFICDDKEHIYTNVTILRTETLSSDIKKTQFFDVETMKLTKLKSNKNVKEKSNLNDLFSIKYSDYLNHSSIELINQYYKKDFELFNYNMINCDNTNTNSGDIFMLEDKTNDKNQN